LKDLKYWVWLSSIPKVGSKKGRQLIEHFETPENLWHADEAEIRKLPGIGSEISSRLVDRELKKNADLIMDSINKSNIDIITIMDERYPEYLRNIYDPPMVLYVKGRVIPDEMAIAIVGSRKASSYGLQMAESIAYELASRGICVISGMARGVDTYAHRGALRAKSRTIAVLGCGTDVVYPSENGELADNISKSGALVSEYIPGTPPLQQNFPARNRIISGISTGVVVVEANERSGSLITANFALEQGREVFAVPGNVNSTTSRGANRLIREGAKIVTCLEDILEELRLAKAYKGINNVSCENKKVKDVPENLDENEKGIYCCLADGPMHIDIIAQKSGLGTAVVNSVLIIMELKGMIEQMPGKIFRLKP